MNGERIPEELKSSGGRPRRGPVVRCLRALAETVGEFVGEVLIGGLCLALFAGVAAATAWGWQQSRAGTAGVYVAVAAFLTYGAHQLWRSRGQDGRTVPRGRVAGAAAATVLVVAFWLLYVAQWATVT